MYMLASFLFILLRLMFGIESNNFVECSTLTTAKLQSDSFPKPTTLYRRINVERNLNVSSSSHDFLMLVGARRKKGRKSSDIWKWDYWCQLQPKKGTCKDKLTRFYYDSQLDKCLPFVYSGCDNNKNNFQTFAECKRHCEGASYMHIKDSTKPTFCFLQPNTGFCLALMKRYYFDINKKSCKEFIYGGCGGNQNRFETKHACMKVCRDVVQ